MSVPASGEISDQHFDSLRLYVLTPIQKAGDLAETEFTEVTAEQQALKEFINRISALTPTSSSAQLIPTKRIAHSPSPELRQVKEAYEETIMAVEHHTDVYNQSMREDFAEELGDSLANEVFADADVLTDQLKQSLILTSYQRVSERKAFNSDLTAELDALRTYEQRLDDVLWNLEGCRISNSDQSEVLNNLEKLAEERQAARQDAQTYRSRDPIYSYLYKTEPWTYPVLTAIGRFRSVLTVD